METSMKTPRTAQELETLVRAELQQHHVIPPDLAIAVIRDGHSWRAHCEPNPAAPEQGELIARAVEVGDELARHYDLAD
jgi:hypothetical protein